jgi:hypothetical protein
MVKEVMKVFFVILIILLTLNLVLAFGDQSDEITNEEITVESEQLPEEWEKNDEDQVVVPEEGDFEIETIPETTQIQQSTNGPIADFSLQNSLFSAGNFIQGTLVSFTNANPLNFQSMFDSSLFTVTLNEEDQAEIAQTNGFGELGYTYISTTGGNITQDQTVIFVPEGDSPTYIYYNTTEIEFEDGTVYLGTESLTNTDQTKEPSSLNFDQNGFTKLQIQPNNNYTIGDYTFVNNENDPVWACKEDSSCELDIRDTIYMIQGKIQFYSNENLIIDSFDSNNQFTFDEQNNILTFENSNPKEDTLAFTYNGYHKIIETEDLVYSEIQETKLSNEFSTYESIYNSITYTIEGGILQYGNMRIVPPEAREYENIWNKVSSYKEEDYGYTPTGGFVAVEPSNNFLTWILSIFLK